MESTQSSTRQISDLSWVSSTNAWGPVERDRSNGESGGADGRTLTLQGQTSANGLSTHAASEVRFVVPSGCTTFTAVVGVDDEVGSHDSVAFQVYNGSTKVYDSGIRTGSSANLTASAAVTAGATVRLVVTDGGDGISYDHADWGDAKLTCSSIL